MFTKKSTVAGIMSSFTKTIRDLELLAENRYASSAAKAIQADELEAASQEDRIEAEDAIAISKKLGALINA